MTTITVHSFKGGTGKSLIAVFLARYFSKKKLENVVIVSPDAGGVARAKRFREALCRHGINAGLAMIIKQRLNCPVLTIQGERPGPLDARNKLRIEAFIETLYLRSSK